jgi:uridine phosphorylase
MQRIAESELIINRRGAIYHLDLRPEELAPWIITVGDPERVKQVSKHFDSVEYKGQYREFVTHTGYIGNKRLTVISTGIGPDNIDIVLNELDALVNIDLQTRTIKSKLTTLNIIRIGTSGSLQKDIPVDSYVVSTHGLGIDNLLNFYRFDQNDEDKQLLHAFITQTQLHSNISYPYINSCAPSLMRHFVDNFYHGVTVTCPGFYGPQGRILRLGLNNPVFIDRLSDFSFGQHRITNFEMETAAIYGLGKMLGHYCLSLNAIVANRVHRNFSPDANVTVEKLISKTLDVVSSS